MSRNYLPPIKPERRHSLDYFADEGDDNPGYNLGMMNLMMDDDDEDDDDDMIEPGDAMGGVGEDEEVDYNHEGRVPLRDRHHPARENSNNGSGSGSGTTSRPSLVTIESSDHSLSLRRYAREDSRPKRKAQPLACATIFLRMGTYSHSFFPFLSRFLCSIQLMTGSPDADDAMAEDTSYSSDLSASERGDISVHSQLSNSISPLTSPLPNNSNHTPSGSSRANVGGSSGGKGSLRDLFFSAHSSTSRTSFRDSLHSINDNSFRLPGLDEGRSEMEDNENETSMEFAEVGLSEYDENHIAFSRDYNRRHGGNTATEGPTIDFEMPFSSLSDLHGTQRSLDTSGFFDALEEQYMEALDNSTNHSKRTPSIRFADEGELIYDVDASGYTTTDIMSITERGLDVYDEIKDRQRLMMMQQEDQSSAALLEREPSIGLFDGAMVVGAGAGVGLGASIDTMDDDDASSIYEELASDGDSDEEDSQEEEEKKVIRNMMYIVGGMALFAGVGFAAKQMMRVFQKAGDDDVAGGQGAEMYTGTDQAATAGGVAHSGETAAEAAQVAELIGDTSNTSVQASMNASASSSQSFASTSSNAGVGNTAASGTAGGTASTQVVQSMSIAAATTAGNR